MKAFSFLILFFVPFVVSVFISGCSEKSTVRKSERAFYFWKSRFVLTQKEQEIIKDLSVSQLYLKFFDVEWDEAQHTPKPVATITFTDKQPLEVSITPVVFITNETIQDATQEQIDQLAVNIVKLVSGICTNNQIRIGNELQIDCDWTVRTKEKYFHLLRQIKLQPFVQSKTLSATIRLHQLKFVTENGVPPADKGLLMCYNMGNLRHPATKNSIIETGELEKYVRNMQNYQLPLDVALPVFDWYVWFQKEEYKGLIHSYRLPDIKIKQEKIIFERDTVINGFNFIAGDWLRYEESNVETLRTAAKKISYQMNTENPVILLYHLDEQNLKKYKGHDLEDIYNRFR